jgi:cell division protein FtsI/penicillin-binding protein 2
MYVFFAFFAFGLFIIWTTFRYTVLDFHYYKALADKQQTTVVKNPVSRGTIYSNNSPEWVFATSTDLPDMAVDPQAIGDKDVLMRFLTDVIVFEYCGREKILNEKCLDGLLSYVRVQRDDKKTYAFDELKNNLQAFLREKIDKPYLDFVLAKENMSPDEIREFSAFSQTGVIFLSGNLYLNPTVLSDPDFISQKLQSILWITPEYADFLVRKRPLRYVKIIRRMNLSTKDFVDLRLSDEKQAIQKWLLPKEKGISNFVILEPNPTRFFPEKNISGQLIGFVDNDSNGKYGIESYFNDYLRGQEGERQAKKDAAGRMIGGYNLTEKETVGGADIKLTIDRNIQKEVSRLLAEWVKEFRANKGSVVILDPKTGAVIAMANYPDYDPNDFGSVYELEKVSYARFPNPAFDLMW